MQQKKVLIKYGGNAMTSPKLQHEVIEKITSLKHQGFSPIISHGGGPFIQQFLDMSGEASHFVEGLRYTSESAIDTVEAALRGLVNGKLTGICIQHGLKAVGLSGKDGGMVICKPLDSVTDRNGIVTKVDLGRVGVITEINTSLTETLLSQGYTPVICCIAANAEGESFNINADLFAAEMAIALKADHFLLLSNIDGLLQDPHDPSTLISEVNIQNLSTANLNISGGMMPKIEACRKAASAGIKNVRIINGEKPETIKKAIHGEETGTKFN